MSEWRSGWRVVLGAALAAATGVNSFICVRTLSSAAAEGRRGGPGPPQLQAPVGLSLAAPAVGWAMDRWGFRRVYATGISC